MVIALGSWLMGAMLATAPATEESLVLPDAIAQRVRELRHKSLGERIKAHSEDWMGRPYTDGPLGEAGGHDEDPMLRFDTFDCLTFVEEVLALSLAPDPISTQSVRLALRYSDPDNPNYENRRHFMLAEWIPELIEKGWVQDITPRFAGAIKIQREVWSSTWAAWSKRDQFDLEDDRLPVGVQQFWYLPIDAALEAADQIPDGTILFTLRQPLPHIPIAITHVGIKIPGEGPTMRHATKMGTGGVKDDSILWYLEHLKSYENWPAVGLILIEPLDFGPRRRKFE
jgi:hypothetical protein